MDDHLLLDGVGWVGGWVGGWVVYLLLDGDGAFDVPHNDVAGVTGALWRWVGVCVVD